MFAHKKSSLFNATQPIVCVFFLTGFFYVFPTQKNMLNVCKVPLNACGIDASSRESAEQSNIWDYVLAALASMCVNACTTDLKDCLQADDRCGKDYTKCKRWGDPETKCTTTKF